MVEKTVTISGQNVKFKASAAVPRLYRTLFHRDVFKDMTKLEKSMLVKAKTGDTTDQATYDGWYKSVYVPTVTASKPAASSGSGTTASSSDSGKAAS